MKEKILKKLQAEHVTFTDWNSICDSCLDKEDVELAKAVKEAHVNLLTDAQKNMYQLKMIVLEDKYKDFIIENKKNIR